MLRLVRKWQMHKFSRAMCSNSTKTQKNINNQGVITSVINSSGSVSVQCIGNNHQSEIKGMGFFVSPNQFITCFHNIQNLYRTQLHCKALKINDEIIDPEKQIIHVDPLNNLAMIHCNQTSDNWIIQSLDSRDSILKPKMNELVESGGGSMIRPRRSELIETGKNESKNGSLLFVTQTHGNDPDTRMGIFIFEKMCHLDNEIRYPVQSGYESFESPGLAMRGTLPIMYYRIDLVNDFQGAPLIDNDGSLIGMHLGATETVNVNYGRSTTKINIPMIGMGITWSTIDKFLNQCKESKLKPNIDDITKIMYSKN